MSMPVDSRPATVDADSPERWVEAHGTALYRYALVQLRDEHKAEEAVQETFLAALQAHGTFSGRASIRTWLIGILKHKILDQFRRDARELALDEPDDIEPDEEEFVARSFSASGHWASKIADWGDPDAALQNGQFWKILQYCLDNMPERLARLFLLRELHEESTENVCEELSITPANLWTMLYRARLGLRQCFGRHWTHEGER